MRIGGSFKDKKKNLNQANFKNSRGKTATPRIYAVLRIKKRVKILLKQWLTGTFLGFRVCLTIGST